MFEQLGSRLALLHHSQHRPLPGWKALRCQRLSRRNGLAEEAEGEVLFQQRIQRLSAHAGRPRFNRERIMFGSKQAEDGHEAAPSRFAVAPARRLQKRPCAQPHLLLRGGDAELALAEAEARAASYESRGDLGHGGEVHSGNALNSNEAVVWLGKGK